jgi:hypothetical protein
LCSFLWESSKPLETLNVKNFVKKTKRQLIWEFIRTN